MVTVYVEADRGKFIGIVIYLNWYKFGEEGLQNERHLKWHKHALKLH